MFFPIIDDLNVQVEEETKHDTNLVEVCEVVKHQRLVFNLDKCIIKAPEIPCFGYVLGNNGVKADTHKLNIINDLTYPQNKQELQSFLGMVNFLTHFIPISVTKQPNYKKF